MDKFDEAMEHLADMVYQNVDERDGEFFSNFITAHANAMRFLGEHGYFTVEYDDGGRYVSGNFAGTR